MLPLPGVLERDSEAPDERMFLVQIRLVMFWYAWGSLRSLRHKTRTSPSSEKRAGG